MRYFGIGKKVKVDKYVDTKKKYLFTPKKEISYYIVKLEANCNDTCELLRTTGATFDVSQSYLGMKLRVLPDDLDKLEFVLTRYNSKAEVKAVYA